MLATVVLARLLTPSDFGVVTMVTTFSYLLINFGLNGLTEAVVQREEITRDLASTLFWINIACGALLTVAFAAAGSTLASFYRDPEVKSVAVAISISIFLTSISVMHLALLKRAMHFTDVSFNDIRARACSVAVSILLGALGWGYWALVAGAVALPLAQSLGAFWLCRWRPGAPRRVKGLRQVIRFAFHTYAGFSINYGARNTDNLLVGWRFSAQALGYYKKAYDLFALSSTQLVTSITVVVVAALSRVNNDRVQYRKYFLGAVTVMAFVGMFVGAVLTLTGRDLILLLLGPRWNPAGRIFTFFGPGIGIMIIYYTQGWLHLSVGRPDRWFKWGIVEFITTVSLFIFALKYGPVGIAIAWTASFWILAVPAIWYAGRPIGLEVKFVLFAVWRYILSALASGIAAYYILGCLHGLGRLGGTLGALVRVVVGSLTLGSLYLVAVVLLHGGFGPLKQMMMLLREIFGRDKVESIARPQAAYSEPGVAPVVCEVADGPEPLVSILIPAYNAEEWIEDTLCSAIAQTWKNKEIIVVDDGSRDRTFEIASRYQSESVTVLKQANQGAAAARNTALRHSKGDYIQWLDADDLLAPDKIARQLEAGKRADVRALLSCPWGAFMYRAHRARFMGTSLWHDLKPVEWLYHKLSENIFMQTATWLVSRELTEAAGLWDTRLLGDDDGEYFCRVLLASDGVQFVPDAKVYYRTFGSNNLSYIGNNDKKISAHWLSMKMHIRYLRSLEESARVHQACLTYLRASLIYFYPERTDIVDEAEAIAQELGGNLGLPELAWKYSWIRWLFGWRLAKPAQRWLRRIRWSVQKRIDKMVFLTEGSVRLERRAANSISE